MKTLKIICVSFLMGLLLTGIGFTEGKTEQNELDYYAEYTGEIVKSDRNFLLVNIVDTDVIEIGRASCRERV